MLITGARGRLATDLAKGLHNSGAEAICVSRTAGKGFLSYSDLHSSGLLGQSATIVHCAWSSLPATAEIHPETIWTEDLPLLAKLLFEISLLPEPLRPHFLFLSSGGAIYGERKTPAVETDSLHPPGWYAIGKAAAEDLISTIAKKNALACCILRPSNPYGFAYSPEKPQGIAAAAVHAIETGHPMKLFGGGTSRKDFLHLDDFRAALLTAISKRVTGTFNICSGVSVPVNDLLTKIESACGRKIPRTEFPAAHWDVQSSLLSHKKFTDATGWVPEIPLDQGIQQFVETAFRTT